MFTRQIFLAVLVLSTFVTQSYAACTQERFDKFQELQNIKVETESGTQEIIDISYQHRTHSSGLFSVCNHVTLTMLDQEGSEVTQSFSSTVPFELPLNLLLSLMKRAGVSPVQDLGIEEDYSLFLGHLQQKTCLEFKTDCPFMYFKNE